MEFLNPNPSPIFKNRKVRLDFKEDIEPQEIFLDKLAQKREEESGLSEKKFEVPLLKIFLQGVSISFIFILFLLFLRTFQLQVLSHKEFLTLAEENRYLLRQLQAERGVIYDRNFKQLVFNRPNFDLVYQKANLPPEEIEKKKILKEVSQILKVNSEDLKNKIVKSEISPVPLAENLDHQTLIILETKITAGELPGFQIVNNPIREYKDGQIFSHLIGYTNQITAQEFQNNSEFYSISDYVGREGVEKFYERTLRKNPGRLKIERDALGKVISKEIVSQPQSGESLVLWLDSDLQRKIKEELEKKIKELGLRAGAAVALDPRTGGVLSLVSYPSFDNNLFNPGADQKLLETLLADSPQVEPFLNRATSGQYLVGSIIKPLIASAALEEKLISDQKKINCKGYIEIPHRYQPEKRTKFRDWTIQGWSDLRKALAESCNVYFYTIGGGYGDQEGLGPTRMKKYLELFGWGKIPQIDLPISDWASGLVPDPKWKKKTLAEPWWDGDTYLFSIGQGYVLATPLQVTMAFSALANGGNLLEPRVVKKIVDSEKNLIEEVKPKIIRENFIDPENIQIVREGMRQAVTGQNSPRASAVLLNALPVAVAAKTGTAEVERRGCQNCYNIWITAFAPYDDPQIVLTIMLEDVRGLISQVVVPLAKEILDWYFTRESNF